MIALVGRRVERRTLLAGAAGRARPAPRGPGGHRQVAAGARGRRRGGPTGHVVEGSAAVTDAARCSATTSRPRVLRGGFAAASFVDGPLHRRDAPGLLLHLEEANRLPPDTLNLLLGPLGERRIVVPRVGPGHRGARVLPSSPRSTTTTRAAPARSAGRSASGWCGCGWTHQRARDERTHRGPRTTLPARPRGWLASGGGRHAGHPRPPRPAPRRLGARRRSTCCSWPARSPSWRTPTCTSRDARTLDVVLRAALVALSGRVAVRESCGRSAEDVIREMWEDGARLRPPRRRRARRPPPPALGRRPAGSRPARTPDGASTRPDHGADGGRAARRARAGRSAAARAVRSRRRSDGRRIRRRTPLPSTTALTDAGARRPRRDRHGLPSGASAGAHHRRRLAGTDPRLVHRLAVQVIVQRARLAARGRRGSGRLRSARFRFQSDDLDLDRSVEEIAANPYPGHEDFWVQERSAGRRAVVLMVDVSGSMRGAPLVRAALAAASAVGGRRAGRPRDRAVLEPHRWSSRRWTTRGRWCASSRTCSPSDRRGSPTSPSA